MGDSEMTKYAYVIQGSTGSHADMCEWLVEIHTTRASAEDRMYKLNAALDTANLSWGKVDPKEYCTKVHEERVREFAKTNDDQVLNATTRERTTWWSR